MHQPRKKNVRKNMSIGLHPPARLPRQQGADGRTAANLQTNPDPTTERNSS
jgi:hypothetical protein